jgi:hypothetical protein
LIESDDAVFNALEELDGITRSSSRPLLFWIGAGASAWCGYKLWGELAREMHREYVGADATYDRHNGDRFISSGEYPASFSLMRAANNERFSALLKREFAPHPSSGEYERFIRALRRFTPLRIVTTNIDESLEQHLPHCAVVQRTDIAHALDLLGTTNSFIVKLHGSISSIESVVMSTEQYSALAQDQTYLALLARLFGSVSLVLVGTSASEEYLLTLLRNNKAHKGVFGDGPHFLMSGSIPEQLPPSFRAIRYRASSAIGHRSVLKVLESVAPEEKRADPEAEPSLKSAYFLMDLFPPGTWRTGLNTTLSNGATVIRGLGFEPDECPSAPVTLHDILVGLACFQKLCAPIETIGKLFYVLGEKLVAELIRTDALDLIWWEAEEGISFDKDAVIGGLSTFIIQSPTHKPLSLMEKLSSFIAFRAGADEREKHSLLELLCKATIRIRESEGSPIYESIESLLILPQVRRLVGLSHYTGRRRIPHWLAHPVLRVARLTRTVETARILGAASIKFPFGAANLANALFATDIGDESAASTTNYMLYGAFTNAIPDGAEMYREFIRGLLRFRETEAASRGRDAILQCLSQRAGADCASAIDASLKQSIPTKVMQACRDQLSSFLTSENRRLRFAPGVWAEDAAGDLAVWRGRARSRLQDHCRTKGLLPTSHCPCGSTISAQECCLAALAG